MSEPKRIAVIVSGINEEYQNNILKGIRQYALENCIDVCNFVAYGGVLKDYKHDIGEFNLFNLVNFEQFDGIVLLINTINSNTVRENIFNRIKRVQIPIVSIDNDVKDMYYIGIDNQYAMEQMVEHFIIHHKFTRLNFIAGPKNNVDSTQRVKAYKNILRKYNIPIEEERIYYGQLFTGIDGKRGTEKFIQAKLEFPQAIICANDSIALSAITTLDINGYSVPNDVCVSGFDNTYDARNNFPELSSVDRPLYSMGYLACQKLLNHINNVPQSHSIVFKTHAIFSESCGCPEKRSESIEEFKHHNTNRMGNYKDSLSLSNRMSCDLAESDCFEDNIRYIRNYIEEMGIDNFFLCMCEEWMGSFDIEKGYIIPMITEGYSENITVPIAYIDGKCVKYPDFKSSEMLPEIHKSPGKDVRDYYFFPIHFREVTLGYCVVCNGTKMIQDLMLHTLMLNIGTSFQNIRNKLCLEKMVNKLDRLYIMDQLTGIYNRFGFTRFSNDIYEICISTATPIMLLFADLDGLKYINDQYGHNEGDNAISTVARAIENALSQQDICARFGGDEFIAFAPNCSEERASKICEDIHKYLDDYNETNNHPYLVETSIGYYITIPKENDSIFELISIADDIMYQMKRKKKQSNYIRRNTKYIEKDC